MNGKFFFIAIDIGNSEDITLRAIDTLKSLDVLFAEHSQKGMEFKGKYQLNCKVVHLAAEEEEKRLSMIEELLQQGQTLGYISDAGLPMLQDPGKKILGFLEEKEFDFEILPGANAVSLCFCYCPTSKPFLVEGFWTRQSSVRSGASVFHYLSCHDLKEFVDWVSENNLNVHIYKDLTKKYQYVGSLENFLGSHDLNAVKGEFIISYYKEEALNLDQLSHYNSLLPENISSKDRILILKNLTGLPKNTVYDWVLKNNRN